MHLLDKLKCNLISLFVFQSDWTPLIIAASAGHEQLVRLLIGRGANVNALNDGLHSPLQYAASKNHHQVRF